MPSARDFTEKLSGRWFGSYGSAPCPVCQPERRKDQKALTLADGIDGRLLAHCKRAGCTFADIVTASGIRRGEYRPPDPAEIARRMAENLAEAEKKARQAERCWIEAGAIRGSVAETYLREVRGITCPLPETLRYHAACWHGPTASRLPALVSRVEGVEHIAVHRTYLRPDGSGKSLVEPDKLALGSTSGGMVRLSDRAEKLVVAEGIETALSMLCGLLDGPMTAWAALSASGIKALQLPSKPGKLVIAQDGDTVGRQAALELAQRAHALGWDVSLADPGDGADFNDILTGKAVLA